MIKKIFLSLAVFLITITSFSCISDVADSVLTGLFIQDLIQERKIKKREEMEKKYFTPEKAASAYTFPSGVKEVSKDYKKKVSKDTELAF